MTDEFDLSFPASEGVGRPGYVLPIRWEREGDLVELTRYLEWLSARAEVVVVDGSPPTVFARHAEAWHGLVHHLPPDPDLSYRNGKVAGVLTGMRRVCANRVVVADDDVRYEEGTLAAIIEQLTNADLVVPQNYFSSLPWHARWDTARSLLNRALGDDYPGTLAVRTEFFRELGGYDGDVLFENLELIRTVVAGGGVVRSVPWILIPRLPSDARKFWTQRVRQAYDSFAQPARLAAELSILPALLAAVLCRKHRGIGGVALLSVVVAEVGRRRGGGAAVFPADAAWWAPVWLAERGMCSWLALFARLRHGGVRYAGGRLGVAAHSLRALRRRKPSVARGPAPPRSAGGPARLANE